jgi:hypothetical protein
MQGFETQAEYDQAREVLEKVGYKEEAVCRTMGTDDLLSIRAISIPPALHRTGGLSPYDVCARLFCISRPVAVQAVEEALAPMTADSWVRAGVLRGPNGNGEYESCVRIVPIHGLLLAADIPTVTGMDSLQTDFVMPPGGSTMQMAFAAVDHPCDNVLDLGTGCGALALWAARYCKRAVGTDINRRAVALSAFNARLNGLAHAEFRAGSLFEPVEDEQFDRILANPPFVIAPAQRFTLRNTDVRGDEFCRRLIRYAPPMLTEGGFLQMMANVPRGPEQSLSDAISGWFDGLGCDALVWLDQTQGITDYAMSWILCTESQDTEKVPGLFEQWMDYYEREGIDRVSYVLITLRKSSGKTNWTVVEEAKRNIVGPCGDAVLQSFATQDSLEALDDRSALLDRRLRLAAAARLQQQHALTDEGLQVVTTLLSTVGGMTQSVEIEGTVAGLLARCDGNATLGELADQLAENLGVDGPRMREAVLSVVYRLTERGFLVPTTA